jgi:ArsR family transcriptional regulator, arsenate/arsenite/antimonite-responsive transcriptional repressor
MSAIAGGRTENKGTNTHSASGRLKVAIHDSRAAATVTSNKLLTLYCMRRLYHRFLGRPLTCKRVSSTFAYANMKTKPISRVDLLFRAFSDRTRLRILYMLRGGELCVCHIVDVLNVPQPKASRHLAYLRKAGLVHARKQGYWSYYRLAPAATAFHQKLLDCLCCCFEDVPELAKDARRLKDVTRCCR